jgi:Cu-Zn family superoxide dismutase
MATLIDADGASLVIHAAADDYVTDPGGNSGARIACAVLQPVAELRR